MKLVTAALMLQLALASAPAMSADWDNCAGELDYLRRRSSDAADKAREAESKKNEFESKRDELQRCVQYPQVYDLMRDRCQIVRSGYESARNYYSSALDDLGSALDDVNRKVKAVELSCEAELSRISAPPPQVPAGVNNQAMCRLYLSYKAKLPLEQLLATCKVQMSESQCKLCLQ